MLLTLRVQSRSGQPLAQPLSADFTTDGGKIGRSKDCDLVLDDPAQIISRTHASIVYHDGHYYLSDMGSNASMINERVLGIGKEEALADGDRIRIGDYVLEALIEDETQESQATEPWPSPSSSPLAPLAEWEPTAERNAERPPAASSDGDAISDADILKEGGWHGGDEFVDIGFIAPRHGSESPAAARDDVSPEKVAFPGEPRTGEDDPQSQAEVFPSSNKTRGEGASGNFGVTEMFGPAVSRGAAKVSAGVDKPLAPNEEGKETSARESGVTELFGPPVAKRSAKTVSGTNRTATSQVSARARRTAAAGGAPPVDPPAVASDSEVLRALLRGMGVPELQLKKSPVAAAELIGAMLREATSGTMAALLARALTKRESRIGVTVIAPRENNPLKFVPDVETALEIMLNNTTPGYLKPVQAYAEAFSDLKVHEIAVLAGMQSALASVLVRFDPATIERGMNEAGLLEKLLPAHRKAKMWDRMVELYHEISREADHDFQRLFGERFAEAYEEQVRALQESKKGYL